jgi:hypothetical protein
MALLLTDALAQQLRSLEDTASGQRRQTYSALCKLLRSNSNMQVVQMLRQASINPSQLPLNILQDAVNSSKQQDQAT